MTILITGAAGFIGYHLALSLLRGGHAVVGLDNMSAYYDVRLKRDRLAQLAAQPAFAFVEADAGDEALLLRLIDEHAVDRVVHLAAQAGVRYSIEHPHATVQANVAAFTHVLEACRKAQVRHLLFASSSSVYGASARLPYAERDAADHPVSLYAATKKTNELLAHTYSHLYGLPVTGMRFFTVYGPWGRPDMAYSSFTAKMIAGEPIAVFNNGRMRRDFTYVDDVVRAIRLLLDRIPQPDEAWNGAQSTPDASYAPYRIYNVGGGQPVALPDFIATLERQLGRKARIEWKPAAPGDVIETFADIGKLKRDTGFAPDTPLDEGLARFVEWYMDYYGAAPPDRGR